MASLQLEAQHRAETGHLRTCEGVLRERFEARIVNGPHGPVIFERLGEHLGTCALDLHADRERLQAASNQERLERAERRSQHLVREPDTVEQATARRDDGTRHDITVYTHGLRRAVEDLIEAGL